MLKVKAVFNDNKRLIMYGENRFIHHQAFVNVNLVFYSLDISTNKKNLCNSNFDCKNVNVFKM